MRHKELEARLRMVNLVLIQRKEDTMNYDEELMVKQKGDVLKKSPSEIADAIVRSRTSRGLL